MKRMKLFYLPALAALVFMSMNNPGNILRSLGLTHQSASASIVANLTGVEGFSLPYMKIAPEILTGDKTGAAREVCAYIKTYCESSAYASEYEKYRQSHKPTEEEIQQYDAESLKDMKEAAKTWDEMAQNKSFPPDQRAEYKAMADDIRAAVARAEDPTPRLTDWKKNYPEDPTGMVKMGLERYLTLVKSVDFNASLTPPDKYGIKKFVNPAYESKSPQWKAIYRAGREVNQVATEFAKEWLASGIKTGQPGIVPEPTPQTEAKTQQGSDEAKTQKNNTEANTPQQGNGQSEQKVTPVSKAKGLIKSLKEKVIKMP
jgi:hypothetical protein